jgi:hypothetical protein
MGSEFSVVSDQLPEVGRINWVSVLIPVPCLSTPYSLFPTPCLSVPCSLSPVPCSLPLPHPL